MRNNNSFDVISEQNLALELARRHNEPEIAYFLDADKTMRGRARLESLLVFYTACALAFSLFDLLFDDTDRFYQRTFWRVIGVLTVTWAISRFGPIGSRSSWADSAHIYSITRFFSISVLVASSLANAIVEQRFSDIPVEFVLVLAAAYALNIGSVDELVASLVPLSLAWICILVRVSRLRLGEIVLQLLLIGSVHVLGIIRLFQTSRRDSLEAFAILTQHEQSRAIATRLQSIRALMDTISPYKPADCDVLVLSLVFDRDGAAFNFDDMDVVNANWNRVESLCNSLIDEHGVSFELLDATNRAIVFAKQLEPNTVVGSQVRSSLDLASCMLKKIGESFACSVLLERIGCDEIVLIGNFIRCTTFASSRMLCPIQLLPDTIYCTWDLWERLFNILPPPAIPAPARQTDVRNVPFVAFNADAARQYMFHSVPQHAVSRHVVLGPVAGEQPASQPAPLSFVDLILAERRAAAKLMNVRLCWNPQDIRLVGHDGRIVALDLDAQLAGAADSFTAACNETNTRVWIAIGLVLWCCTLVRPPYPTVLPRAVLVCVFVYACILLGLALAWEYLLAWRPYLSGVWLTVFGLAHITYYQLVSLDAHGPLYLLTAGLFMLNFRWTRVEPRAVALAVFVCGVLAIPSASEYVFMLLTSLALAVLGLLVALAERVQANTQAACLSLLKRQTDDLSFACFALKAPLEKLVPRHMAIKIESSTDSTDGYCVCIDSASGIVVSLADLAWNSPSDIYNFVCSLDDERQTEQRAWICDKIRADLDTYIVVSSVALEMFQREFTDMLRKVYRTYNNNIVLDAGGGVGGPTQLVLRQIEPSQTADTAEQSLTNAIHARSGGSIYMRFLHIGKRRCVIFSGTLWNEV